MLIATPWNGTLLPLFSRTLSVQKQSHAKKNHTPFCNAGISTGYQLQPSCRLWSVWSKIREFPTLMYCFVFFKHCPCCNMGISCVIMLFYIQKISHGQTERKRPGTTILSLCKYFLSNFIFIYYTTYIFCISQIHVLYLIV